MLCGLCVSVVQFGTVTVIEGNSPQRRRVHREDLDPQKTTTPDSAQPCFPLCSLCLCGSAHRRSEIGVRSSEIGVGGNDDITWSRALRVPLRSSVEPPPGRALLCALCVSVVRHIGDGSSEIGVRGNEDITWGRAFRVPLRSSVNRPTPIPDRRSPISERLKPATSRRSGARSPISDLPYPILGFPHPACPLPLRRPCLPL